jgi:hypothetical protein
MNINELANYSIVQQPLEGLSRPLMMVSLSNSTELRLFSTSGRVMSDVHRLIIRLDRI